MRSKDGRRFLSIAMPMKYCGSVSALATLLRDLHTRTMIRTLGIAAVVLSAFLLLRAEPVVAEPPAKSMQVYKSPTCGCCTKWVDHVKSKGYEVSVSDIADVNPVKRELGVPPGSASCHTAFIGGYFVEGHVPVEDITRLLTERPNIAGIAVPGMPIGSPGMEGPNPQAYKVLAVKRDGKLEVFAEHRP